MVINSSVISAKRRRIRSVRAHAARTRLSVVVMTLGIRVFFATAERRRVEGRNETSFPQSGKRSYEAWLVFSEPMPKPQDFECRRKFVTRRSKDAGPATA